MKPQKFSKSKENCYKTGKTDKFVDNKINDSKHRKWIQIKMTPSKEKTNKNDSETEIQVSDLDSTTKKEDNDSSG